MNRSSWSIFVVILLLGLIFVVNEVAAGDVNYTTSLKYNTANVLKLNLLKNNVPLQICEGSTVGSITNINSEFDVICIDNKPASVDDKDYFPEKKYEKKVDKGKLIQIFSLSLNFLKCNSNGDNSDMGVNYKGDYTSAPNNQKGLADISGNLKKTHGILSKDYFTNEEYGNRFLCADYIIPDNVSKKVWESWLVCGNVRWYETVYKGTGGVKRYINDIYNKNYLCLAEGWVYCDINKINSGFFCFNGVWNVINCDKNNPLKFSNQVLCGKDDNNYCNYDNAIKKEKIIGLDEKQYVCLDKIDPNGSSNYVWSIVEEDSDDDGVIDSKDKCKEKSGDFVVDKVGCIVGDYNKDDTVNSDDIVFHTNDVPSLKKDAKSNNFKYKSDIKGFNAFLVQMKINYQLSKDLEDINQKINPNINDNINNNIDSKIGKFN